VRYRLTRQADRDIVDILRETLKSFGPKQLAVYAAIIDEGIRMVAENPTRPSSLDRSDIRPDVRSLHLELAARRRGGAAHKLYFTTMTGADEVPEVVVLRVLHERMEPKRPLLRALRIEATNDG
jgi:toxin ParE1/3/4